MVPAIHALVQDNKPEPYASFDVERHISKLDFLVQQAMDMPQWCGGTKRQVSHILSSA
jgi:hypothetical protein